MEKKLVTIKHFLLNVFGGFKMCDKMAIPAYILKIVENDPFLRLQMKAKTEKIPNRHFKIFFPRENEAIKHDLVSIWRSFVTMATNLPSCFSIQFLEQLLKFLINFTLLKYVRSQGNYGFLITKELIFGFQILDLKDHFSASLRQSLLAIQAEAAMSPMVIFLCQNETSQTTVLQLPTGQKSLFFSDWNVLQV